MSITYNPATNFTAKDSMATTNPDKVLSGVPFDFEFSSISAAFQLAAPTLNPTFTGTLAADAITANTVNGSNTSNWDAAFSWGNHADEGYLTSFTETDPTVPSHVKAIEAGDIVNWDAAYGWGNHADEGYLTTLTETDPIFTASPASGITSGNISNWNTAYNDKVTNMSFNNTNGVLTLTQQDLQTLTVDLDGRYAVVAELDQYTAGSGLLLSGSQFSHADTSSQASSNNSGQTFIQDIILDQFGHITGLATGVATDTNTDTTYSAGTALSLSGTTFSHGDTSSVGNVNNSGNTFIQDLTFDTFGHVTGVVSGTATDTNTDTTYSAGTGLTLSGTTFSHTDTSSQASVSNTGQNFIQGITLDTNGHITGISTGTASDTNTTYSAGTNLSLSGTTINMNSSISGLSDVATNNVSIGNFDIQLDGSTSLRIRYGGTDVFRIDSAGNLIVKGNVTAYGSP